MFKYVNPLIASFVLGVVLAGLFNPVCRELVFHDTVGGFFVGIAHGLLHILCILDHTGTITRRRAKVVMHAAIRTDLVIGLLIGVGQVVACACGK